MQRMRLFDLAFFSVLAWLSEWLASYLTRTMGVGFSVSFTLALTVIAMIRWGPVGCIAGVIGGVGAFVSAGGEDYLNLIYYAGANVFLALPTLVYGARDTDWITDRPGRLALAVLACYLSLCVGKWLALIVLYRDWDGGVDYFFAELIPLVFNLLLCLLLRSRDGLICNMRLEEDDENGQT